MKTLPSDHRKGCQCHTCQPPEPHVYYFQPGGVVETPDGLFYVNVPRVEEIPLKHRP